MKLKLVLPLLVLALVAACGPAVDEQPRLRIAISPAAHRVSQAVMTCAPQDENLFVSIDSPYPGTFALEDYDIFIRLGEPQEDAFAAQLAWERIVIIANPTIGIDELSRSQAADLFSGRVESWDELGGAEGLVTLWVGPQSDETRLIFTEQVLLGSPVSGEARLAGQPSQVLAEVATDSGGAGLLPAAWADISVQQIDLEIEVPVLAISVQEPDGAARQLLACLQSEAGQSVLSEHYAPLEPSTQPEE